MKKRGQGLPVTTIIIAILALLVLVVILLIFTGKIRVFGGELVSCSGKGGFCYAGDCAFGYQTALQETDCAQNQKCCLPVLPLPDGKGPCKSGEHCSSGICGSNGKCASKPAAAPTSPQNTAGN